MTVKELIEKLQQYPDKFEVVIRTYDFNEVDIDEECISYCQEDKKVILEAYY